MFNPYVQQIMDQTGMTEREVRTSRCNAIPRPLPPGFDNWDEYYQAVHDYISEQ